MEVTTGNRLDLIPDGQYEGYLWYSGQKTPEMISGKLGLSAIPENPFIVEGLLYDKDQGTSVHIQHVGRYVVSIYHLQDAPESDWIEKEYLPHRLKDVRKVCFRQIWEAETDPLCEEMSVLKLKGIVFCGFKMKSP